MTTLTNIPDTKTNKHMPFRPWMPILLLSWFLTRWLGWCSSSKMAENWRGALKWQRCIWGGGGQSWACARMGQWKTREYRPETGLSFARVPELSVDYGFDHRFRLIISIIRRDGTPRFPPPRDKCGMQVQSAWPIRNFVPPPPGL